MRGWSYGKWCSVFDRKVIPANAGVILSGIYEDLHKKSYPRECGGDPECERINWDIERLSPRMRGWSWANRYKEMANDVIPANAGVILDNV